MKTPLALHRFFALALLAFAAAFPILAGETPQEAYRSALYLERGAGDFAAAFALYERVAGEPAAGADLAAQACWRAGRCLEQMGRRDEAAAQYLGLLAAAPAECLDVRATAARALLRLAEEASAAAASAEWKAKVKIHFPQMAEQLALERAALRRTLHGVVDTWDGRRPVNASLRIRARPATPGPVDARSTWRTQTDAEGNFSVELPIGRHEVRIWAPAYERVYVTTTLTEEEESPSEIRRVLPRIRLPATVARVDLVGNFLDDWEGVLPLVRVGAGIWEVRRQLGPGHYEYKFRVNEGTRLVTDVAATAFAADSHEDFNGVIEVDQAQEVIFRFDENDPHFERAPDGNPS